MHSPAISVDRFNALVDALDRALPQTQCRRCGYDDCKRYATAIASGDAATNRCPPGGEEGVRRLSLIAGTVVPSLDPTCGAEGPRQLAVIDESWCIGCALCLEACPVDAITGAAKRMHTVIDAHCTGCELCIPVCPVDCISLVAVTGERTGWKAWTPAQAADAKQRYDVHRTRSATVDGGAPIDTNDAVDGVDDDVGGANPIPTGDTTIGEDSALLRRRAAVASALARARERRGG